LDDNSYKSFTTRRTRVPFLYAENPRTKRVTKEEGMRWYTVTFENETAPCIRVSVEASSREEAEEKARGAVREFDRSQPATVLEVEELGPSSSSLPPPRWV
jgi:hypothetical protein